MTSESDVAPMHVHRCPTCGKSRLTLSGYKSHWYWAHGGKQGEPRPPYQLDALSTGDNSATSAPEDNAHEDRAVGFRHHPPL